MKTGLFFGSFNPVHIGHLIIADYMANFTGLDRVFFVVSPQNPFKTRESMAKDNDRLYLVKLAVESNPRLDVSDIEFSMPRPSYTIDTLTYLTEKYPSDNFTLIMGEDNLLSLHKWKNYEQILENYTIHVYPRLDSNKKNSDLKQHPSVRFFNDMPILYISATEIRKRIKNGDSVRYLLPETVMDEIDRSGMYR